MRKLSIVALAAMLALVFGAGSAHANGELDYYTEGSISWLTARLKANASSAFFAAGSDLSSGRVSVTNHSGLSFEGTVDCFAVFDANQVSFSGPITSSTGTSLNGQGTTYYVMLVQDGQGIAPDKVTLIRGSAPFTCGNYPLARQPITGGDLVVGQLSCTAERRATSSC